jgi:uncharacterized protein (DUF1778 family)
MTQTAMNTAAAAKRERLEMRVDSTTKMLAERAAAATGTTTTDLIASLIREHAPALLERTNHIKMTNEQFDEFAALTQQTTSISDRLQEAAKRVAARSN